MSVLALRGAALLPSGGGGALTTYAPKLSPPPEKFISCPGVHPLATPLNDIIKASLFTDDVCELLVLFLQCVRIACNAEHCTS